MPRRTVRETVVIGFNPGSGSGNRLSKVEQLAGNLRENGFEVIVSSVISETVDLATRAFEAGNLRAFVCGGGDGTIRTMAEKLPASVPIAVFPLGTENLLARYLGITSSVEMAVSTILHSRHRTIDAGEANGRLFLVMASCGFDADVVRRMHATRRGNIYRWSWFLPTWQAVWNYRFDLLKVTIGQDRVLRPARWAFVFNVPRYAMDLRIAPEADPEDAKLDICTFPRGKLLHGLIYVAAVFVGQHRRLTRCENHQTDRIRIESDAPVPFQLDGDPGGELPLEIRVLPKRVKLLVPPNADEKASG